LGLTRTKKCSSHKYFIINNYFIIFGISDSYDGDNEEYRLLVWNSGKLEEIQTFRRNILPPSPGLKSKLRKKTAEVRGKQSRKKPAEAYRIFQKNRYPPPERRIISDLKHMALQHRILYPS
jgi:hypothetical protein